jgi:leader peptidase (prepilin peptidase) / N-methyltransferase
MKASLLGVLLLVLVGAAAGLPLVWAASRFEGAGGVRRGWLAAILPLLLLMEAVFTPPSHWLAGGVLACILLMIAAVDALTFRIPDLLSLPLIAIGLAAGAIAGADLGDRVIGAALGFLVLAALAWAYRALRGREGLGLGDAKLLAAGGAWVGWQALPTILLLAAGGGLLMAAVAVLRRGREALAEAFAFGPALAGGVWVAWLLAARHGAG